MTLRAWRYRVVDAVPLAAGSRIAARQGRLTVRAVDRARDGVQVDARSVFLQRLMLTPEDLLGSAGIGSGEHVAMRNSSRKQAILRGVEASRQLDYSMMSGIASMHLGTGTRLLRFTVSLADEDRVKLDDEWLAGAELIVLRPEDLGVFTRPLRVEWFTLDGAR